MLFRLLIDIDFVEFARPQQQRLNAHFRRIQEYPGHYSDLIESDAAGRHVKILRLALRLAKSEI